MEFKKKDKYREDELPVYEMMIEDDDDSGIRFLSIVTDPAIELKGQYFNNQQPMEVRFKADTEQKKIVGPAMIPNKKIYRNDEDGEYFVNFSADTILKMVRKFTKSGGYAKLNYDHSSVLVDGYIEQSWIVKDSRYDKSQVYGYSLPVDTWFVEIKIEDDNFWTKEVKENGFCSFSIEGMLWQQLQVNHSMRTAFIKNNIDAIIDSMSENDLKDLLENI